MISIIRFCFCIHNNILIKYINTDTRTLHVHVHEFQFQFDDSSTTEELNFAPLNETQDLLRKRKKYRTFPTNHIVYTHKYFISMPINSSGIKIILVWTEARS